MWKDQLISCNVDANEAYDPTTDKWTVLEHMDSKKGYLASAAVNGSIIRLFGGEHPRREQGSYSKQSLILACARL
jgi:hypothetical protein